MSTNTTIAHSWIKLVPFAVILLAVALTLSLVLANLQPVVRFGSPASDSESSVQRSMEADAARYNAMAEYFAAKEVTALQANWIAEVARYHAKVAAAGLERGRAADATRYHAMAEYFAAKDAAYIQNSRAADTARYNAMVEAYFAQKEAAQRGIEADAARYTGMAIAYSAQKEANLRGINADAARYSAMAAFYSTWLNDPAQATGIAEHFQTGK